MCFYCGKVSLLIGNPQAYRRDRRYVDGNLSRSFGDSDDDALDHMRAILIHLIEIK
jgi:succinylglutamate desuccinylase